MFNKILLLRSIYYTKIIFLWYKIISKLVSTKMTFGFVCFTVDYLFLQVFLELGPSVHPGLRKSRKHFFNALSGTDQPFAW